jgi:hypothetical protein
MDSQHKLFTGINQDNQYIMNIHTLLNINSIKKSKQFIFNVVKNQDKNKDKNIEKNNDYNDINISFKKSTNNWRIV